MNVKNALATLAGSLIAVTPAFAQGPITSTIAFLQGLGFAQILLWLITFAVVFGVGKRVFGSKAVSAIVGIASGFLVLMAVPAALIGYIATMSTGLLVGVVGILAIIVFLEVVGVRRYMYKTVRRSEDPKTGKIVEHEITRTWVLSLIALAVLGFGIWVFASAGGPSFFGLATMPTVNWGTVIFVIIILAALYWLVTE
jgi:hypothetical protein